MFPSDKGLKLLQTLEQSCLCKNIHEILYIKEVPQSKINVTFCSVACWSESVRLCFPENFLPKAKSVAFIK